MLVKIHILTRDEDHDASQDSRELVRLSHGIGDGNDLCSDLEVEIRKASKTIPIQSLQTKRPQSCI
jgi:O-acetylhomoserine/O-acetylserine sulfhydrylase-like pyridoxal-dependent enzyme